MPHHVKVAEADELPPGKGKVVTIEGHEVTITNLEGRYVARATVTRLKHGPGSTHTTCGMPGGHFTAGTSVSPDRLRSGALVYEVIVDEDGVWLELEDA